MNKRYYIVYTLGGFTQDEHGEPCENSQVLGLFLAECKREAIEFAHDACKARFPRIDWYGAYKIDGLL
jgi:hypothetical protein